MSLMEREEFGIEKIIQELQEAVDLGDAPKRGPFAVFVRKEYLVETIALLRTHQDAKPNEPLRWRSFKKEKPTEKGRYEVVCRNGDIPPYVLLGFWNPDNPGWDLYGVTHWRPLPDPPKEESV